jgi:non-heme chloroperoxidase
MTALYLIHGMWGHGGLWDNWRAFFEAEGYRCLTPTLRHHDIAPGDAPDPALGTTGLLDYVSDLEGEIRELEEPPVLIGHSLGGLLAQILSARGLGRKTVLLTPAASYGIVALRWSVLRAFASCLTRWAFWRKPHLATFNEVAYSTLNLMSREEQWAVYRTFVPESGRAIFESGLSLLDRRRAAAVDERGVRTPMLVVAGSRDRIVPPAVVTKVAEKYRAVADLKVFDDQAHWVLGQPGWESVAAYVKDWIARD